MSKIEPTLMPFIDVDKKLKLTMIVPKNKTELRFIKSLMKKFTEGKLEREYSKVSN
jgi:hypothetical protein